MTLTLVLFARGQDALAGNGDSFFLSDDAALTGGAVVATARGGGSSWYNPAGVVYKTQTSVDVSASAFVLRIRNTPGIIQTITPNQTYLNDLNSTELLPVPSALVFVKRMSPKMALSFGVFVPEQDVYIVQSRFELEEPFPDQAIDIKSLQIFSLARQKSTYYAGASIGYELLKNLRIGGALYVVYRKEEVDAQFFYSFVANDSTGNTAAKGLTDARSKFSQTGVGVRAKFGLQWEPARWLNIGLCATSPLYLNWSDTELQSALLQGSQGGPQVGMLEFDNSRFQGDGIHLAQVSPWEIAFGLGLIQKWGSLRLQITHRPKFSDETQDLNEKAVTNFQVGARIWTSERFSLGLGVFSDRSAQIELSPFGEPKVHYYGGSLGLSWAKRYAVANNDETDRIQFSTTIAFRYAMGVGKSGGFAVAPFSESEEEPPMPNVDVRFHEMSLHIGSGIYF